MIKIMKGTNWEDKIKGEVFLRLFILFVFTDSGSCLLLLLGFFSCSGQCTMHVEITPCVLLSQMSPKRPVDFLSMNPTRFQSTRAPKRKLQVLHSAHINAESLNWILNSIEAWKFLESFSQRRKDHLQSYSALWHEDFLKPITTALVIAGGNDSYDSQIRSCCRIISTFKKLQHPYFHADCYG